VLEGHRRTIETRARWLAARGIEVRVDVRWEHPLDAAVASKAAETRTDLVLKSTRFHAELGRSLFSAADFGLMTSCPTSLWLVKPRPIAKPPTILAAIDPRPCLGGAGSLDEQLLESGIALERATGGELHVFHGFDIPSALAVSAEALATPIAAPAHDIVTTVTTAHRHAVLALTPATPS